MVGRSCRAQGSGRGILYLLGDPTIKKTGWEILEGNDAPQTDSGGLNLALLMRNSRVLGRKEISFIIPAFKSKNW